MSARVLWRCHLQMLIWISVCSIPVAILQEIDGCKIFFTVQPPLRLPCNPHISLDSANDARFSLQCTVHAPKLDANLPERNFTIEWVREEIISTKGHTPRATADVIGAGSSRTGLQIENHHATYFYSPSESHIGLLVDSKLSFDLSAMSRNAIRGRYWCKVLVKTLDNYSYSDAGRSNTETLITDADGYSPLLPPCVARPTFHQPQFQCLNDNDKRTAPVSASNTHSKSNGSSVSVSSGGLAAVAVTGGILIVAVLILVFVVVYSCRVAHSERKGTEAARINRASLQSTETQEEEHAIHHTQSLNSKPGHLLDQTSLGHHNHSYRVKTLPHHLQVANHQKSNSTLYSDHGKANSITSAFM